MASTNHTPNLNLNQWEANDPVIRQDFNADNAKIDAAVAARAELVFGTYTGNGAFDRTISLGFTPKAVLIFGRNGVSTSDQNTIYGGLILPSYSLNGSSIMRWYI